MKHRLSHNQTEILQLTGLVATGIMSWVIALISIKFLPLIWALTGAGLISGLTFHFSLRIYKAEFDVNFLYLTRRLNKKKIDLKYVIDVKTFPFSIYLFLGHAYIISLKYSDANKQKKAFVISRGLFSWTPNVNSISEITLFRQYILEKKYGR